MVWCLAQARELPFNLLLSRGGREARHRTDLGVWGGLEILDLMQNSSDEELGRVWEIGSITGSRLEHGMGIPTGDLFVQLAGGEARDETRIPGPNSDV